MTDYPIHTVETAPDAAKPLLEKSRKAYNMIPNLHAAMATSPQLLEAYQVVGDLFSKTSLTATERNVVWLSINVEHNCHYCVPAHTGIAKAQGVDDATIEKLRNAEPLDDAKLEALRQFTLKAVRQRGVVSEADVQTFLDAGYTQQTILDVMVGIAHKVMSNYVNHFVKTPVDDAFKKFDWTPRAVAAE
ncbi:MAG: carboxymuconolactone decarboxylase family protein [Pseudomonadota bacterium]